MKRAYVGWLLASLLMIAGCGTDGGDAGGAGGSNVEIEAGDLYFQPTTLSASAGGVRVLLDNVGAAEHDFVIEELGDLEVVFANPGETSTGTVDLEPGTCTFYCSIPGHRDAGMEGTLEVQ